MLIKRILLVALVATATTSLICKVDPSVMGSLQQYGVQSNRIDQDGFNALIEQAKLVDNWDNTDDLAVSSIIRAQFTDEGDTTMNGLGRGEAFNNLFVIDSKVAAHELKELVSASSTPESRAKAIRILSKIADNKAAGRQKTVLMSAASGDADVAEFLEELASLDAASINNATGVAIEFGSPYTALDYARHTGNAAAEGTLLSRGATARAHGSLQGFGAINK